MEELDETSDSFGQGPEPPTLEQVKSAAANLSESATFSECDALVQQGVHVMAINQAAIMRVRQVLAVPLKRIHDSLTKSSQGRRTDLLDGTPENMTWSQYCEKMSALGSRRTFYLLIKDAKLEPAAANQLPIGTRVRNEASGEVGVITNITKAPSEEPKLTVQYENDTKPAQQELADVKRLKIKKLEISDIVLMADMDGGAEYVYIGKSKFMRTSTPTANQKKKQEQDAAEAVAKKRLADHQRHEAERAVLAEKAAKEAEEAAAQMKDAKERLKAAKKTARTFPKADAAAGGA